jgi:hypothetical protein
MSLHGYIPKTKPANWTTVPGALKTRPRQPHVRIGQSTKTRRGNYHYRRIADEFLAKPENNFCRVHWALTGQKIQATCIHHLRGRHKTLKYDTRYFCPTSWANSGWPHQNIERARQLGLIAQAGEWAVEPGDSETERLRQWMQEKGI